MPKTLAFPPSLLALIHGQDGVVSRAQLEDAGIGRSSVSHRIQRGQWRWLLPGVLLTQSGYPTRRQRLVAAWLWAGERAAVDAESACYWYGIGETPPVKVHLVVPADSTTRSQSFVVVRRAVAEIRIGERSLVPYVDPATALVVAARNAHSVRAAIAFLSRGLQLGLARQADLVGARESVGDKWCRQSDLALVAVGAGARSPGERDVQHLILTSRVLPEPLWNQWLDLGDGGGPVCADALWKEAGLLHETNGRRYHAWGNDFEDMQTRHDRLTVSGLVVLHNAPARIRRDGRVVLSEIERTYARYAGRGLPPQVRLIPPPGNRG